jgi:prepilin-type N-terminal cleavage/methylation domain-containing protein
MTERKVCQNVEGFSLVELMATVAIIAIIAAIAVPIYSKQRCKGHWGEIPSCLGDVSTRLENFRSNHGVYPTGSSDDILATVGTTKACGDHYEIEVFTTATEYYLLVSDTAQKIGCSAAAGDDQWVQTSTSPKLYHISNPVDGKTDPDPGKP